MITRKKAIVTLGVGAAGATAAAGAVALSAAVGAFALLNRRGAGRRRHFADQVVVITGSSRGLGLALAEEFGRAGARLVLTARDPYELERARSLLLERGAIASPAQALIVPCDIRENEQANALIERAVKAFGRVDVLVNNAGIITVGPVEQQALSAFEDSMNTNFYGMLHCTLAVLPQMLARGDGSIVNICSIGGKIAVPHLAPYSASKFAAVGLSEGLHVELRSKGIRVTTVCPGLLRTGSAVRALFAGDRAKEYRWFSLGASLPFVSMAAAQAAKEIIRAAAGHATEITLTPQAAVGARLMGLFPSFTQLLLHLSNFALPGPTSSEAPSRLEEGRDVRQEELRGLTALGTQASHHYNEGI